MSLPTESVTLAGSGLVFVNYYGSGVSDAYRGAVLDAEHILQGLFTDATTVGMRFDLGPLSGAFAAYNTFSTTPVSYTTLVDALQAHATSADDFAAVAGLPAVDPSNGVGFSLPFAEARVLGLAVQTNSVDDSITLNNDVAFDYGADAVGTLLHEITEGVFGRIGGLGLQGVRWKPMDLFRFAASGQRDVTGGADGVPTFFGIDGAHVTGPQYHSAIDAAGRDDGFDLADWDHTRGDAFGPVSAGTPTALTPTDVQILDILGWGPAVAGAPYVPPPDEFASSLTDTTAPFGLLAVGGSASGALQSAGDRDWFKVTLEPGVTYTINQVARGGGGGTVADSFLRLHDASGGLLAFNDDVVSGGQPDSRIVFTATTGGTYYVEAGSFVDGYTGTYRLDLTQGAATPTAGDDALVGATGGATIDGLAGNDTITGGNGPNYLRGGDGNDAIGGGGGFDDINGNMGDDTLHGGAGDDWVVGGKGNDLQFGGDGADVVLGNLGDDTLSGDAGNDIVRGGQGNDILSGGAGNDYVSGDRGDDTMTGGPGADLFHSFGDAGIDRVTDFSVAEGDRVMLDPGSTYTVAQVGADTVISIAGGAQMTLVGVSLSTLPDGWIFVG
ncbi:NF038122 family metalloprotease [Phenylobacterium sp.]|uniref:NF038122 family metalloprotease n=1 Tax=Phenylobacterium sp. TaxID=1871053 RepID=UPI0025F9ABBF|nr:NF038122 family metalloprotease [Phenylobacterium sp.]